mmetsp:Transcript_14706/g.51575  ORF Transcript_14706/g.51575 Transcript_14706/m.51575 type:complete len:360 (-) Transcript_14706:136-1215(-)
MSSSEAQALVSKAEEAAKEATKDGRTKNDLSRAMDYIKNFKDLPEESPIKQALACFLKWGVKPLIIIVMAYVWVCKQLYKIYKILPTNILQIIFGVGLCFFGGCYFASIAAIEAALNLGGPDMWDHLTTCYNEVANVGVANTADDQVDMDKNGIMDVKEMGTNELINHKAKVAMMSVKEPQKLQQAVLSIMNIYLAVIATLKFEFAKTVAVCMGVANMLSLPACRIFGPLLCAVMGPELNHWVPAMIDTTIKIIAVWVATFIQSIISAFYSGLRGGKLIAEGFFNICTERGWMEKFPDFLVTKPFDPDKSYLDEVISYPIAAAGFYYQFTHGFALEFPLNLICLPLTIVEWFLRFQIYT